MACKPTVSPNDFPSGLDCSGSSLFVDEMEIKKPDLGRLPRLDQVVKKEDWLKKVYLYPEDADFLGLDLESPIAKIPKIVFDVQVIPFTLDLVQPDRALELEGE